MVGLVDQERDQPLAVLDSFAVIVHQRFLGANGVRITCDRLGFMAELHAQQAELDEEVDPLLVDALIGGRTGGWAFAEIAAAEQRVLGLVPAADVAI